MFTLTCSLYILPLQVHGLLHVLDYDHELGPEASQEMEEEEGRISSKLGWKGKGLINATAVAVEDGLPQLITGKAGKFVRLSRPSTCYMSKIIC